LAKILAYGTDGEATLVKAFKQQFCFAVHLRCFRHIKQDIQRKLNDMGFKANVVSEILSHIFDRLSLRGWLIVNQKVDLRTNWN